MVEGGMTCVKYLVFGFNLLFFLFGAALVGLGIYVQVQLKDYLDFFSSDVNGPAILLIVVGTITFVVAFFGCCGAFKENYCMVMTFAALVGVIFIIEMGAGIAGFVLKGKVKGFVNTEMKDSMTNYKNGNSAGVTLTWDQTQQNLECCGVGNYTDWFDHGFNKTLPVSCCKPVATNQNCTDASANLYDRGCLSALELIIEDNVYYVGAVALALAIIELAGIILACCLGRSIKSEYEIA